MISIKRVAAPLGLIVAASLMVLPAVSSATKAHATSKTYHVHMVCAGATTTSTTGTQHSTCTGKPFGKVSETIVVHIPTTTCTFKNKYGSFVLTGASTLNGTSVTVNWHATKGKGRYRHIRGSGKDVGQLTPGSKFTFTGSVRY